MGPTLTMSACLCRFHACSVLLAYFLSVYAQVAAASCPGGEQFCRAGNGVRATWHHSREKNRTRPGGSACRRAFVRSSVSPRSISLICLCAPR